MSSGHVTLDESCSQCLPWLRRQTRRKKSNLQPAFSIESLHGQARNKLRSSRKHETSARLNKRKPRILRRWDLSSPTSHQLLICCLCSWLTYLACMYLVHLLAGIMLVWVLWVDRTGDTAEQGATLPGSGALQQWWSKMPPGWQFPLNTYPWPV